MGGEEVIAFLGLFASVTIVLVTFTKAYMKRLELKDRQPREVTPASDERLARLEQAVDAIAVEVERISEGQRFVAKLLADRHAESSALPPAQRAPR